MERWKRYFKRGFTKIKEHYTKKEIVFKSLNGDFTNNFYKEMVLTYDTNRKYVGTIFVHNFH